MTRPTFRAVIFDVDGTLVDSVDIHAQAWQRAFAHFGHAISFNAIRSQIGKGGDQLMPVFLDPHEVEQNGKTIEAWRADLLKREGLSRIQGFPQVRALFDRLKRDGIRIALASSAKSDELKAYTKAADIEGVADVETSSDDAEKSKPHPDIFQAALKKLRLDPSDAVVIGDTPYDAEAASKAGLRSLGVLCGGFPEPDIRAAGAAAIFRDPADLLARWPDWGV